MSQMSRLEADIPHCTLSNTTALLAMNSFKSFKMLIISNVLKLQSREYERIHSFEMFFFFKKKNLLTIPV